MSRENERAYMYHPANTTFQDAEITGRKRKSSYTGGMESEQRGAYTERHKSFKTFREKISSLK